MNRNQVRDTITTTASGSSGKSLAKRTTKEVMFSSQINRLVHTLNSANSQMWLYLLRLNRHLIMNTR
nr:unnamed protein product [Haemonchus contortus]